MTHTMKCQLSFCKSVYTMVAASGSVAISMNFPRQQYFDKGVSANDRYNKMFYPPVLNRLFV